MTDVASSQVYVRPNLRDLREIPLDSDTAMRARMSLTPRELGVWFNLRTHLWMFGDLPAAPRRLAAIGGVGAKSFEKMIPVLAPLFDRDETGRWRDLDLEEERGMRLDLTPCQPRSPALEERRIDPNLSETRSRAGREGGRRRWEERRKRLQLIEGGRDTDGSAPSIDDAGQASGMADGMANGIAKPAMADMAKSVDLPSGFASVLPSFARSDGSDAPGLSDRLSVGLQEVESESLQQVREESDRPTAGARADADDGKTSGKPAGAGSGGDGKTDPSALANGSSAPMAKSEAAAPSVKDATAVLSDAAIVEALREAGKGKIPLTLLTPSAIAPIRVLVDLGCGLTRDIVPAVAAFVGGLSGPLRSWQAKPIREAALALRDQAASTGAARAAFDKLVFIAEDTPQWRAWLDHKGKKTHFKTQKNGRGPFGCYFASEWPPDVDARLYDERLAIAARSG